MSVGANRLAVVAASVLLLAGCAQATPAPAPKPVSFTYGASATAIATAVKACKDVKEETPASTAVGISSLASCTIDGKRVDFYSWDDATAQGDPGKQLAGLSIEAYYAAAEGWSAQAHEDGDLSGQQSVAKTVAKAIGGEVFHAVP